jgi:hypothetical protein
MALIVYGEGQEGKFLASKAYEQFMVVIGDVETSEHLKGGC